MKKIFLLIIPILLLTGCGSPIVGQSQNSQTQASQQQVNNLDIQAQCATQAGKTLNDFKNGEMGKGNTNFLQQNHYNQKMNKCFVCISSEALDSGALLNSNSDYIFDAYENNYLAGCNYSETRDFVFSQDCFIGGNSASYKEYSDFVNQRMESEVLK